MHGSGTPDRETADLEAFLAGHAPFDSLDQAARSGAARAARIEHFAAGDVIVDAFAHPTAEVFVLVAGAVELWNTADRVGQQADERVAPGGVFGYSAMLTERPVGPRAVAVRASTVARIPASAITPAFSSPPGARFLAEQMSSANRRAAQPPSYSLVDDLIEPDPLVVDPTTPVGDVARLMTERGLSYAAVRLEAGRFGLVTDAVLRRRVLVDGRPPGTPARDVMAHAAATTTLGDSAAEALISLLDQDAEFLLVTDRTGTLCGVISAGDFVVSPTTAGVALHEQIRRAAGVDELVERTRRVPDMLGDVLAGGLASGKVIAVYSAIVDTVVRRAIGLTFARHPDLSVDAFTWLSLGSNGRREAVLSSDVDSAVAFDDEVPARDVARYRAVFAEVNAVLTRAGIGVDEHGATAQRAPFSRTNAQWRAAGARWLAAPEQSQGAIMISLLVDGRPIHGDPGLPEVTKVFGDLRRHPATMRLLLQESLARRARLRTVKEVLTRRADTFDIKTHAILPVVNLARWAALGVGSAELPTTRRLRAAAGSEMLPEEHATTLVEVFEALQRVRLRYQLAQRERGESPSDVLERDRMSPIDRSIVAQAVREIAAAQRRMDNISAYVPEDEWLAPR